MRTFPTWLLPPVTLDLHPGEVHIWRSPLAQPTRDFWSLLSADEQARCDRLRFPQHRQRAIGARGILRTLLGRYLQQPPDQLQFVYVAHGKPSLAPAWLLAGQSLEFNLSHSQDWMLCAFALNQPVGIDLEQIRPMGDLAALTQRFFAPAEHRAIQALPADQQTSAFFQYWTCKEAILKATAKGLGGLDTVELEFPPGISQEAPLAPGQPVVRRAPNPGGSAERWQVRSLMPMAGFWGAIASHPEAATPQALSPVAQLRFWQWGDA